MIWTALRDVLAKVKPEAVPAHPLDATPLGLEAIEVARGEVGRGESGANNRGSDLARYGVGDGQNWCAAFVWFCYEQAALNRGHVLTFKRSLGARRLWKNAGNDPAGRFPDAPAPGDMICWARGNDGWSGHIGIVEKVEDGMVHTIEGNSGPFPAKVRRRIHDVQHERLLGDARVG